MVVKGDIVPGFSGYGITRTLEVHDPVASEMHIVRPHGIAMSHNLRDSLHIWTLLFVDVNATMCQSWFPRCVAWTA